jgi:hypothetical protein
LNIGLCTHPRWWNPKFFEVDWSIITICKFPRPVPDEMMAAIDEKTSLWVASQFHPGLLVDSEDALENATSLFGSLNTFCKAKEPAESEANLKRKFTSAMALCKKVFGSLNSVDEYKRPRIQEIISLINAEIGVDLNTEVASQSDNQLVEIDLNSEASRNLTRNPVLKQRKGRPKGSTLAKRFTSGGEISTDKGRKLTCPYCSKIYISSSSYSKHVNNSCQNRPPANSK